MTTISGQEAVVLAKGYAETQGWIWVDPARATYKQSWFGKKNKRWEVYSNSQGLGAMVRVVIDAETGAILDKGYIPR
jgi:hypothetical protein